MVFRLPAGSSNVPACRQRLNGSTLLDECTDLTFFSGRERARRAESRRGPRFSNSPCSTSRKPQSCYRSPDLRSKRAPPIHVRNRCRMRCVGSRLAGAPMRRWFFGQHPFGRMLGLRVVNRNRVQPSACYVMTELAAPSPSRFRCSYGAPTFAPTICSGI